MIDPNIWKTCSKPPTRFGIPSEAWIEVKNMPKETHVHSQTLGTILPMNMEEYPLRIASSKDHHV